LHLLGSLLISAWVVCKRLSPQHWVSRLCFHFGSKNYIQLLFIMTAFKFNFFVQFKCDDFALHANLILLFSFLRDLAWNPYFLQNARKMCLFSGGHPKCRPYRLQTEYFFIILVFACMYTFDLNFFGSLHKIEFNYISECLFYLWPFIDRPRKLGMSLLIL